MKNIKLAEIKPYPKNAKKHSSKQIGQVAASIKEFGFNQPIVIDKEGIIIVGHGRYEAAKLLGLEEVPVLEVDLTKEQAKVYRLADNKLNESIWDMDLVLEELNSLSEDFLSLTGFDLLKLEEVDSFEGKNKEINISDLEDDLDTKCPQCGFKFN
jgi:ParB-like chromosome segregation protein Spo0J